jgi:hypothetical protein
MLERNQKISNKPKKETKTPFEKKKKKFDYAITNLN